MSPQEKQNLRTPKPQDQRLLPEPLTLRPSIEAGITGGLTLFGAGGRRANPGKHTVEHPERGGESERMTERSGKVKKVVVVTVLTLTLLAGGSWLGAETAGTRQDSEAATRQARDSGEDAATGQQNTPVVRPHPRGLPRKAQRNRRRGCPSGRREYRP